MDSGQLMKVDAPYLLGLVVLDGLAEHLDGAVDVLLMAVHRHQGRHLGRGERHLIGPWWWSASCDDSVKSDVPDPPFHEWS